MTKPENHEDHLFISEDDVVRGARLLAFIKELRNCRVAATSPNVSITIKCKDRQTSAREYGVEFGLSERSRGKIDPVSPSLLDPGGAQGFMHKALIRFLDLSIERFHEELKELGVIPKTEEHKVSTKAKWGLEPSFEKLFDERLDCDCKCTCDRGQKRVEKRQALPRSNVSIISMDRDSRYEDTGRNDNLVYDEPPDDFDFDFDDIPF